MRQSLPFLFGMLVSVSVATVGLAEQAPLHVLPTTVNLSGKYSQAQLLVRERGAADETEGWSDATANDWTAQVRYESSDPEVVRVDERGRLLAQQNGTAQITVHSLKDERSCTVAVTVSGIDNESKIGFEHYVRPILSKAGCNSGACHASQYGKGGFILSVFGFEPEKDRDAIAADRNQRRVNFFAPERSLVLRKPSMQLSHGGGKRLELNSPDYLALLDWIAQGAPAPDQNGAQIERLSLLPERRVTEPGATQQLQVLAHYNDGTTRDVTHWAKYDSLDDGVVNVDENGFVSIVGAGQASVLVRFEGNARNSMFMVPHGTAELAGWESINFVDELAAEKFVQLGIEPSPLADDYTFVRRAFLDAVGSIPTVAEVEEFVADTRPNKRELLVDRLLGLTGDSKLDIYNDRYAALWTLKWSDLLRNSSNGQAADEQRMWAMHNWIKEAFRTNKPFDQFVRELVTAKGSIYSSGPASYFRINANTIDLTESTTQLFLGLRLGCAQCHQHPFEKYSQEDYYSFAAFFSRVGTKNSEEFGLFGRESVVIVKSTGEVRHPKTGKNLPPRTLDGEVVDHELDRRIPLADWLTSPNNKDFARSVANRYVSYLLGRGLVEPVDDMRETNPATNQELLDRLAEHFVASGFDIKQLMRAIMTSRLYQLSSHPTSLNAGDDKFYSHYYVKRLAAEPLLDAVDQVTQVRTKFKSLPIGTRAIELPDGEYPDYFLTVFGKPRRASVCECERIPDENLSQALHTLNGEILAKKLSDKSGRVLQLVKEEIALEQALEQLYLAAMARPPRPEELEALQEFRDEMSTPQEFYEDVLWMLLNSKEFLFNH